MVGLPLVEAFVPQMLNYESVGGVNFKKGCYPGQEVVARSQFRGTLKRRAYLVHAELPGVKKEDIHVHVEGNTVAISAEVKQEKADTSETCKEKAAAIAKDPKALDLRIAVGAK